MSILEFLNRAVAFIGSILPYLIGAVFLSSVYGYLSAEDYYDDTVTFTVSCSSVRNDREHYPASVVDHCDRITTHLGK